MTKIFLFAALFGLAFSSMRHAQDQYVRVSGYTGNELLKVCESGGENRVFCLGYIEGVSDGAAISSSVNRFQLPERVSMEQLKDIVVKYLRNNPEIRDRHAAFLITKCLEETFPVPSH